MTDNDEFTGSEVVRCYGSLDFLRNLPFDDVEGDLHDYLEGNVESRIDDVKRLVKLGGQVTDWNRPENEKDLSSWQKTAVRTLDHDVGSNLVTLTSIMRDEGTKNELTPGIKRLIVSTGVKVRYALSTVRFMLSDEVGSLDQITLERQRQIIEDSYRNDINIETCTTKKPIYLSVLAYGAVDNLIRNARRYKNEDNITYREFYDAAKGELRLEISDKGSGIVMGSEKSLGRSTRGLPAEEVEGLETEIEKHIPRLFERDYSTRSYKGAGKAVPGLGLHLVYLASKTYGGHVEVETVNDEDKFSYSTEDEILGGERNKVQVLSKGPKEQTGTTFTLVIPMEELDDRIVPTYGEVNRETIVD